MTPLAGPDGWIDTPTHVIDVMATCVDLAGATYPDHAGPGAVIPMPKPQLKNKK